jgi:alpha-tubulin suppressor-like RCC1 family protein
VKAIAANWGDTCALMVAGGVKCWGTGFLGNGKPTGYSLTPVDVVDLPSGVMALAGGGQDSCVITSGGGLKCWGEDHSGELGVTPTTSFFSSSVPVDIPGLTGGVSAVSLGSFHLCAVTSAGGVKCWGGNPSGQLGNGTLAPSSTGAPGDVSGLTSGVTAVAAGNDHTCALTTAGGVKCWGSNSSGALGSGPTVTNATTPIDVAGL